MVCHYALVDLAGEEPFQAADNVLFGGGLRWCGERRSRWWVGGISCVLWLVGTALRWLGGVRLGRDGSGWFVLKTAGMGQVPQSFARCGFGADPFGVVAEHDEDLRRRVGSDAVAVS